MSQLEVLQKIVNHYRKFVPLLADLSDPLNRLLKKDIPWKCSEECKQSFIKLKEALMSTTVLTYYDPKVKVALACDASSTGIRAVIYHVYQDETENQSHMHQKHCQVQSEIIRRSRMRPSV